MAVENGIPDWFDEIKGYILDMDGVLYRGDALIPEVPRFLDALKGTSAAYMMATNNATRTPDEYVTKLGLMGIESLPEQIFTSTLATASYLRATYPEGSRAYVVGMRALHDAVFGDEYFSQVTREADVVVSSANFELVYEQLRVACLCIRSGADYVATNADTTFPTEEGLIPGAGAIVAALVASTDVQPTVVGKPSPVMIERCLAQLGLEPHEVLMVGDRLDTDILAGQRAGTRTVLVTTGISSREDVELLEIEPDWIIPTLEPLSDALGAPARR